MEQFSMSMGILYVRKCRHRSMFKNFCRYYDISTKKSICDVCDNREMKVYEINQADIV